MSAYSPCQIKFAFDVSTNSPLNWHEYFGWEDTYDMLKDFLEQNLKSDTLSFSETDSSGAKLTIVFETSTDPVNFQDDYNLALSLLEKISLEPNYNECPDNFNNMLEALEEMGIVVYEEQPDSDVFKEYNKLVNGFETYTEHVHSIGK